MFMPMLQQLKQWAKQLKVETLALSLAARHKGTPWYAKVFVAGVVAYALSPIDLIPDFVPILGYLDELVLLPLGITVALKMIPAAVMSECRARARTILMTDWRPVSRIAGAVIVVIWLFLTALFALWLYQLCA